MKSKNYIILPIVAGAFTLTNCNKKTEEGAAPSETSKSTPEKIADTPAEPTKAVQPEKPAEEAKPAEPAITAEQVAAKTGFAKHLPKASVMVMNVQRGKELVEKVRGSAIGKLVETLAGKDDVNVEEMAEDASFQQFAALTGEEVFFGIGEGGDKWIEGVLKLSSEMNFQQMKWLTELAGKAISGKQDEASPMGIMAGAGYIFEILKSKDTQQTLKDTHMAPLYVAFKVSDEKKRKEFIDQLHGFADQGLQEMPFPVLEEAKSDAGKGFKGFSVKGDEIAKLMEKEGKEEMVKYIGEEAFQAYVDIISKKKLTFLAGEVDGYVVIFVGGTADQLKLAENAEQSVLTQPEMSFTKQFVEKDVVGLLYSSSTLQELGYKHGGYLKNLVNGIIAGLKSSDSFGDTRVLEALLGDVCEKEDAIISMHKGSRMGVVAYLEEGFKVDFYGGDNAPGCDFQSKRSLAPLTQGEDIVFSANWVTNPAYMDKVLEYMDAIGSTSYQIAKQVSTLDVDSPDFKEFCTGFEMFDTELKADLLIVWKALRVDLTAGLGNESALVVDINGDMPTVPEVPSAIVKQGKIPRIAFVSTVDDRAKLSGSWESINGAAESLLAKAEKLGGPKIPMQRPMMSESNNLTSWSFPVPFTHPNCLPSLSVSDELFFASTSPEFSKQLTGKFDAAKAGEPGAEVVLHFDVVRKFADGWVKLLDAEGKSFLREHDLKEFQDTKPLIEDCLKASEELDKLIIKSRHENGEVHSSLHLKVR